MIKIDRSSGIPVPDQLAEQLRYLIASHHYKVHDALPPARKLAEQAGVSFHTVRKAYQLLIADGLLEATQGKGYHVIARTPLTSEERLERGADVVQKTVLQLVGLGLDEGEIEYLVQEQLAILNLEDSNLRLAFVAPYLEMADQCAEHLSTVMQLNFDAETLDGIESLKDADYLFCPTPHVRQLSDSFPRIDIMGITVYLTPDILDRIARLLEHEALGLVTYHANSIPFLMSEIQQQTGFSGQIFGASLEDGAKHLNQFIDQVDLIVYTPMSRRRVMPYTKKGKQNYEIAYFVSEQSLKSVQQLIPSL